MTVTKVDLRATHKELYTAGREPGLVDVPQLSYLAVDGHGDPNTSAEYLHAVEALFSVSYALKFALKRGPHQLDYGVMPLEGLWWVPDMSRFSVEQKSDWDWTVMIMQPDLVDADLLGTAIEHSTAKKELPAARLLRLERYAEGLSAQVMHVGPYAAEGPTIQRLHDFIAERGYDRTGKHHEIYLGDPRRSAPERLRTIIRQPVAPTR
jgi:hypothetical protein